MVENHSPKVLLISNDVATAGQVRSALTASGDRTFHLDWVLQLSDGLDRAAESGIAVFLLDLSLAGGHGFEAFNELFATVPEIPILILCNESNSALAATAVAFGAQDYLLPQHLDAYCLPRALHNAIDRKMAEDALYFEHELALVTLDSIGDAVLSTDIAGRVTYLNAVAESMTGWSRGEAIGRHIADVFHIVDGETREIALDPLQSAMDKDRAVGLTSNCILIRRDGREAAIEDSCAPIHDRLGRGIGAVIIFRDIAASRAMADQMTHAAQHDLLTHLPNRLLLDDRIGHAIAMAHRQNKRMAVMFLDLDNFKAVNDFLGHATGDKLLQSVANRLLGSVRESDTVSRHGGDEFVIVLSEIAHARDAALSAKKILLAVSAPHSVAEKNLQIYCSLGIAIYPDDGEDAETLIHRADTAMYHAKEAGRNRSLFFRSEMNLKAAERLTLENRMRTALEQGEFLLHYQPKVNLVTGQIEGIEALIRWQRPGQQLLTASNFIPAAEESGLIVQIGRWVVHEACRQVSAWHQAGLIKVPVSVNVSAMEFRDLEFIKIIRKVLAETELPPEYLELELTEGVLMENTGSTAALLKDLKAMGVQLAVDDFGSGFSSLNYLRQIPLDSMNIGRSWVHQIDTDTSSSWMISAMINMGKSLKHRVVAEGIETEAQKAYLQENRCDLGQGYLFSHPLPTEQIALLLETAVVPTT